MNKYLKGKINFNFFSTKKRVDNKNTSRLKENSLGFNPPNRDKNLKNNVNLNSKTQAKHQNRQWLRR